MTEKNHVVCEKEVSEFVSLLKDIPMDVAVEVLAQYPEFVIMMKETIANNQDLIKKVIDANQQNAQECFLYYQEVLRDISLCLENPNLTYDQRLRLIEKEIQIAQLVGEKESELREINRKLLN